MKLAALALSLALTAPLCAQTFTDPANQRGERVSPLNGHELPIDGGDNHAALGLAQLLRKLNTRASILNIVAHPDDEDGGMLTLYARGFGARVTDLALTRGEGGQNFVTGDFEDALGLIRTQELLANDRYTGVQQMFGTEVDFGFSKTREEAFAKWTHERVLYDAVRAIRIVRPLVITATFIGNVTDGHGQHQVSGEIAQEAFKAAADPSVFPDMIAEGILPWQALKVYARVPFATITASGVYDYATNQTVPARFTNYVTGRVTTTKPPADVTVPEGSNDPLLTVAAANPSDIPAALAAKPDTPLSYIQFGRIGLSLQRSQISKNMTLPVAGFFNSGYTLYGSVLCNAPASARPSSLTSKTCHPEQAQRAEGPTTNPTPSLTSAAFNHRPAPTARSITAQGNALGQPHEVSSRAEGPIQNPALTTQPNFFTGIDTSIEGIATLAPTAFPPHQLSTIANAIAAATNHFDAAHPDAIAPDLAAALSDLDKLITSIEHWTGDPTQKANSLHELRIKRVQLNDALALSLGLTFDAPVAQTDWVSGSPITVTTTLKETAPTPPTALREEITTPADRIAEGGYFPDKLSSTTPYVHQLYLPDHLANALTEPYFYRDNIEQPVYKLRDYNLRNAPQSPPALTASANVPYEGVIITVARVVHNNGQPISIIPPASIASLPSATVLPSAQTTAQLTATLTTDTHTSANINVQSPQNWTIQAKAAGPNSVNFFLHPTAPITTPQLFHVTAQTPDHHTYSEGYRAVGYPGLIYTNYFTPAITRVVPVDLKLPEHLRIAYLPGTGDSVPEALASIGLAPTMITVTDLNPASLARFDTVVLGVRAYTAHTDLQGAPTKALLDFARSGGNVVVQYQTSDFTSADAPYPLDLGPGAKVVVETDPVALSNTTNPLLTTPNQITSADFNGWIAERGHGFLASWDPQYTTLTETNDPGGDGTEPQAPQRGGLITAHIGKGRWTYVAFALYRQLPEAVPGAFRLFVNLVTPLAN